MNINELKAWLEEQGFSCSPDNRSRYNECNWYAGRKTSMHARECETNKGKGIQIVLYPYLSTLDHYESVEIKVVGEYEGVWYTLKAYSLKPDDVVTRLSEIESKLITAWNALAASGEELKET